MADTKKIDTASAVKAIIQMGYSCEVVLTRLSKEEIEKHTRRKQHILHDQRNSSSSDSVNTSVKRKRARVIYSSDDESCSNNSETESMRKKKKKKNEEEHLKHDNPKKILQEKCNTKNSSVKEISSFSNSIDKLHNIEISNSNERLNYPKKVNRTDSISKKKKEKMEMLFGEYDDDDDDDDDDGDFLKETSNRKTESENRKQLGPTFSATINVNFYCKDHKSEKSTSSVHKTSGKHRKENSYKLQNKIHRSKPEYINDKTSKKCDNGVKKSENQYLASSKPYSKVIKTETVVERLPKSNIGSEKIQLNLSDTTPKVNSLEKSTPSPKSSPIQKPNSSPKRNDSQDIQGIWSSLGMQSPADRSDKIISNTLSETFTLYRSSESEKNVRDVKVVACGMASDTGRNNTESLNLKYRNEKCIGNDGTISGTKGVCHISKKHSAKINKNQDIEATNINTVQSDSTEKEDLAKKNVSENSVIEYSRKQECHITANETEITKKGMEVSGSEICSINATKAETGKQYSDNCHAATVESIELPDSPDCQNDTKRTVAFSSSVLPASVESAYETETCSSNIIETIDDISNTGSCSSVEIVEMDTPDDSLVICDSSANENSDNLSNSTSHNNEDLIQSSDVSNISKDSVGICNRESNSVINKTVSNSNIGKIRVKDPKLLGIQSFGIKKTGQSASLEVTVVSQQKRPSVEDMTVEELLASSTSGQNFSEGSEEDYKNLSEWFKNYKKYFNELIESKLPKMGELLDLAVADSVRRDIRIQHSEKLSSPDLIKQEKLKAEKEYSDSLKARGIEFTALLENIVKKFDQNCAEDMILALYSRILDVFKLIDKQNKKHIARTRIIIQKMLHKNNYKNEFVYKILCMKTGDFSQGLAHVSHCILTYNNMVKSVSGNVSETQPTLQSATETNNIPQISVTAENVVSVPATAETYSQSDKDATGPAINLSSTSEIHTPLRPAQYIGQSNTAGSVSGRSNSFALDNFVSAMPINSIINKTQVSSDVGPAALPNHNIADYGYNRISTSVANNLSTSQYGSQLPSYSAQPPSSVNTGGIVNNNLPKAYHGQKSVTNTRNMNTLGNVQGNIPVVDVQRGSNSLLMHMQKSNNSTPSSRIRSVDNINREKVISQYVLKKIMQKYPKLIPVNDVAVARDQSANRYNNGNTISSNSVSNNNQSNQPYQNSRQQINSLPSRMNVNHSIERNVANTGQLVQNSIPLLSRNQSVMQQVGDTNNKLSNQNQTAIGSQRNTAYASSVPFPKSSINWEVLVRDVMANVQVRQSDASNHDFSQRQISSNVNCSRQNVDHAASIPNITSIETATVQSNKLPEVHVNSSVQNRNIAPKSVGVIQKSSTNAGDSRQAVGNQQPRPPPPPPYDRESDLLLKCLLRSDNYTYPPQSETLRKVVDERVYLQKQSEMRQNLNIVPRVVGQQSVKWTQGSGMSRTLDNQSRSIPVQPQRQLFINVGGSSTSNVSAHRATIADTNPNEISYQRIRQVVDVHNMRTYPSRNVPVAIRPSTSNVLQTGTVSKTNDRLPVISEVFSSGTFTLPDQNLSSQNYTASVNNMINNTSMQCTNTSLGNTNSVSLQSNNTTAGLHLNNNNSGRSPVLRQSSEAPVSTYVNTGSSQNSQILSSNNTTLMDVAISAPNHTVEPNFQLVYSNSVQSIVESSSTTVCGVSNVNAVGSSSHSVSALPYDNTNNISTSSASSGHPASVPSAGDNSFHVPSAIIHHLPSSVSDVSEITGDQVGTDISLESQALICARSGCNQKSDKLCSVCKSTTYCSHECQTEHWYNGHAEKCRPS